MNRIFYVIPDVTKKEFSIRSFLRSFKKGEALSYLINIFNYKEKPIGGIKVIYQHVMLLKELGYNASLVKMGNYSGNFFNFQVENIDYDEIKDEFQESDVVIIPEIYHYYSVFFQKPIKVLFAQNWCFLYDYHPVIKGIGNDLYFNNSYSFVLSVSDYITSVLSREPKEIVYTVKNFIEHDRFYPRPEIRIKNRIMVMPRKNKSDIDGIINCLVNMGIENYEIFYADALKEFELIMEYQKSDIYLATGYPEGFGLPPLEALACGCVLVGFTGGGANEFMINNQTALVVNDGDVKNAAKQLARLLGDENLKKHLRKNGIAISKTYNKINAMKQLDDFYRDIILKS